MFTLASIPSAVVALTPSWSKSDTDTVAVIAQAMLTSNNTANSDSDTHSVSGSNDSIAIMSVESVSSDSVQDSVDASVKQPEEETKVKGALELPKHETQATLFQPPLLYPTIVPQESSGDDKRSELLRMSIKSLQYKAQDVSRSITDGPSNISKVILDSVVDGPGEVDKEEVVSSQTLKKKGWSGQGLPMVSSQPSESAELTIKAFGHTMQLYEKQKENQTEKIKISAKVMKEGSEPTALLEAANEPRYFARNISQPLPGLSSTRRNNPDENLSPVIELPSVLKEPESATSLEENTVQSTDTVTSIQEEAEKMTSELDQPDHEVEVENAARGISLCGYQLCGINEKSGLSKEQIVQLSELITEDFASKLSGVIQNSDQVYGWIGIGRLKLPSESESKGFWRLLWWLFYALLFVPYSILNAIAKFFRGEKKEQLLIAADTPTKAFASEEVEKLLGQQEKLLGRHRVLLGGFIMQALEDQGAFFGPTQTDLVCVVTMKRARGFNFAGKEDTPRLLFFKRNPEGLLEGPIKVFCFDCGASNRREMPSSYCLVRQQEGAAYEFSLGLETDSADLEGQNKAEDNILLDGTYIQEARSSSINDERNRVSEEIAEVRNVV
jgi:hypothetical protein